MIYLNQAASSWPKPELVRITVREVLEAPPQAQYRSASQTIREKDYMKLCRGNLARLFGVENPERIFFTSGSTEALNLAILGLLQADMRSKNCPVPGSCGIAKEQSRMTGPGAERPQSVTIQPRRLVITEAEHNAVLRTVYDGLSGEISSGELEVMVVPCDKSGHVDMAGMREAITENTALVAVNHCSNVTGAVQDLAAIGRLAHKKGALFLADASQSAGCLPVDVKRMGIDLLAFTGHKALLGMPGVGGLYIRKGITLRPLKYGGTGRDSAVMIPEEPFYETGTANIPGIASLWAGTEVVLRQGMEAIREREALLMQMLFDGLSDIRGVRLFADKPPEGPVLSFVLDGLSPSDLGYILGGSYGITVRTGLHCAPLIHRALGTQAEGTVRVSPSWQNTEEEIKSFLEAVGEIADGLSL